MGVPELSVLSRDECLRLLDSVPVGRVGLTIRALPVVFPVNFALMDGEVVFRTVQGTKFHAAAEAAVLAFEADGYEPDGTSGWSVLVQGVSRVVHEPTELRKARQLTIEPWALDGSADRIVRITSSLVSGRRFQRGSP
jgi:nitroimidazol reductase NimA-like FMN-containing flavoprotein (pyridoxamine 5'-phosphate oxidase superfamily)